MLSDFCPAVSRIDHRGFIGCWLIVSLTKCVCVCVWVGAGFAEMFGFSFRRCPSVVGGLWVFGTLWPVGLWGRRAGGTVGLWGVGNADGPSSSSCACPSTAGVAIRVLCLCWLVTSVTQAWHHTCLPLHSGNRGLFVVSGRCLFHQQMRSGAELYHKPNQISPTPNPVPPIPRPCLPEIRQVVGCSGTQSGSPRPPSLNPTGLDMEGGWFLQASGRDSWGISLSGAWDGAESYRKSVIGRSLVAWLRHNTTFCSPGSEVNPALPPCSPEARGTGWYGGPSSYNHLVP